MCSADSRRVCSADPQDLQKTPSSAAAGGNRLERTDGCRAIVLLPTRELAQQVFDVAEVLTKPFHWLICGTLLGGEKKKSEKARLRKVY